MLRYLLIAILLFSAASSCRQLPDRSYLAEKMISEFRTGNFKALMVLEDSVRRTLPGDAELLRLSDSLADLAHRIKVDFPLSPRDIINFTGGKSFELTEEKIREWESLKWLEYRIIDGEKRYFNRAVSNLMLLKDFYENRDKRSENISNDPRIRYRLAHTSGIVELSENKVKPVVPVSMKIKYSLSVAADAVPEGELIRCWLPWPKKGHPRQSAPELLSASVSDYIISPDTCTHSTLYMEKKAVKGEAARFEISFRYTSSGQYFNYDDLIAKPYDRSSELYKTYTREELPHISFSQSVRELADSISGTSDDPKSIVRNVYLWFKENIPWTGALEYSIMPDIPAYVCENLRGDCGMQTFLFLSVLRYKGIPARWQSGWMVPPGAENLHDWSEVWFEGTGWVPADISYDLQDSDLRKIREFYLSGIDSYRMIVNEGIAGKLFPAKTHRRSEPYDFQRGEVEWRGGNLYFDKWDYSMEIEYLQ